MSNKPRCPICGSTHMLQRARFMCAGDCADTAHQYTAHSAYLCHALGRNDVAEVAQVLRLQPAAQAEHYAFALAMVGGAA